MGQSGTQGLRGGPFDPHLPPERMIDASQTSETALIPLSSPYIAQQDGLGRSSGRLGSSDPELVARMVRTFARRQLSVSILDQAAALHLSAEFDDVLTDRRNRLRDQRDLVVSHLRNELPNRRCGCSRRPLPAQREKGIRSCRRCRWSRTGASSSLSSNSQPI